MIKYLIMTCNPSFQTQYAIVGSKQIYIDEFQESEITPLTKKGNSSCNS